MGNAQLRFIPWSQRGLSTAIQEIEAPLDAPGIPPLKLHASIDAGVTVTAIGDKSVRLTLYGPGDVIGIDPRLIIRAEPKPHTTDAEPNYLAAIEFDLPELPWMFTPARPTEQADKLRPWLVLVVVETSGLDAVALPKAIRTRPLPFISLTRDQVSRQLPDLDQSWAWAHSQLMVEEGTATDTAVGLAGDPKLNLSRLICPRHLEPMTSYMACLVPAFDVGVIRGLGGLPGSDKADRAWDVSSPQDLELPVYFHWEFATGPEGDFESLARQLEPFQCPPDVGTVPIDIWHSIPGQFANIPTAVRDAAVLMDGALRASEGEPGTLGQIDVTFQEAIREEVDEAANIADNVAAGSTQAIGPPLYGGLHAKKSRVPDDTPAWLRELNLDPRGRIAAGLGAEVIRANQEEFVQSCWEQVGRILDANALLSRSWLAVEALSKLHVRIDKLPPAARVALTGPVQTRVPFEGLSAAAVIARSSMPDAVVSPALRRLASSRRPSVRVAAKSLGDQLGAIRLIDRLAQGVATVDPNRFEPDGISGSAALAKLSVERGGLVDLSIIGIATTAPQGQVQLARTTATAIPDDPRTTTLRRDIELAGLPTDEHLAAASQLAEASGASVTDALASLATASMAAPRADALLLEVKEETWSAGAIDIDAGGRVLLRNSSREPDRVLATLAPGVALGSRGALTTMVMNLSAGSLSSERTVRLDRDVSGRVVIGRGAGRGRERTPPPAPSRALPPLRRDAQTVQRLSSAFDRLRADLLIDSVDTIPTIVPFALAKAATAVSAGLNPRANVPARLATMIKLGAADLTADNLSVHISETFDRIMAAPQLPEPMYGRLAAYRRDAFLPGIDEIPMNSITLLETNPRFIEAFMIGLNYEMNRELLWRSFPTDQRGTPFRFFWDWYDDQPDIPEIHKFRSNAILGRSTRGGAEGGNLVLLVRGHLLRRYPNATISAWRSERIGGVSRLMPNPGPDDYVPAAFFGSFPPDISFAGFPLTREDIDEGEGWFFVIQQQPTEPRFGFDEADPDDVLPAHWLDARWIDTETGPGHHLNVAGAAGDLAFDGIRLKTSAAHLAAAALQRPFRLAVHARYLTVF